MKTPKPMPAGWNKADSVTRPGTDCMRRDCREPGVHVEVTPASISSPKDKGWVIVRVMDGRANCAQYYPSFKQLIASFSE